jgi:UPF0755 protein
MADVFFDQDATTAEHASPPPEPPRRLARWLVALAVLGVVALLAVGAGAVYVRGKMDPSGPRGEEVTFVIERGATTTDVAEQLADEGIISDATLFRVWLRTQGNPSFAAGTYTLRQRSSFGEALAALEAGPALPPAENFTIPEGLTLRQLVEHVGRHDRFEESTFAALLEGGEFRSKYQPEGKPLEGLLYPDTYRLEESDDEVTLLERMIGVFEQVADSLGYGNAEQTVGVSPYEAIIVASLVEEEAKADEDRAKIARVIYNRLEQGMTLGIDATFYYALPEREGRGLRQSDLAIDSPYNTRTNAGLIPTPIALPGRASLEAAINPEPGPWLYYVLKDQRTHAFSESYDEFLRNRRFAQENGLIP